MIKVQNKLVSTSDITDVFGIHEALVNSAVVSLTETIQKEVIGINCSNHPNAETTILISGNQPGNSELFSIEISNYCCEGFKDSIKLKVS